MGKIFPMIRIAARLFCAETAPQDFSNSQFCWGLRGGHHKYHFANQAWHDSCSRLNGDGPISQLSLSRRKEKVVTIRSGQKQFTEDEVSRLTGICLDHLRSWAQSRQLGSLIRAAEAASAGAEKWLFSDSDLMIVNVLCPRCEH